MLLHIGTFHLDVDSQLSTPWHRLTPRTRLLCVLLGVFAIALTPNGRWLTWAIYGLGLLVLILLSRVTLPVLLQRVVVEFVFIAAVLLGTLFRDEGEVLWSWAWFKVTTEGVMILGSVALKAFLSLTTLNVLILTTSIPSLFEALAALRTPPLLIAILASMYRYIAVLVNEFNAMRRAALSRNLTGVRHWQRLIIGNMIGSLFIRTYERGDRIYQAMLARGYDGLRPLRVVSQESYRDIWAITLTLIVILFGQIFHAP